MSTDQIEKQVVLRAPVDRVWQAVSDARHFGSWFGVERTRLTITETGFDSIPVARRAAAIQANDGGWSHQSRLLAKYLELHGNPA